jgi:hypothetical protein
VAAFLLAGYALTLPRTPPQHRLGSLLAPLAALHLLRKRSFAVYLFGSMGVCLTMAFYLQGTQLLLRQLGVRDAWLSPLQTISQSTEVLTLALLPMILLRLDLRGTMRLGLIVWCLGLAAFAVGEPLWLVAVMLGTWGMCVGCYLVVGQVFINSRASGDIRTSAQALYTCVNGVGQLIGYPLAGWVRQQTEGALAPMFTLAAGAQVLVTIVFLLGFREDDTASPKG